MTSIKTSLLAVLFFVSVQGGAAQTASVETWLPTQLARSQEKMMKNISAPKIAAGSVIASPSRKNPDYFFHWIRDAALTMNVVFDLHLRTRATDYLRQIKLYAQFSRQNQLTANPSGAADALGLGEPKFHVDGRAFTDGWGRPQTDGPALRAITLIRLANLALNQGDTAYVRASLYDGKLPSQSVIKLDLEYVANHWRLPSFDLWEEVMGDHFYTRMVQRRALVEGAKLALRMGDGGAAGFYQQQAKLIETEILKHWDQTKGYFVAMLNARPNGKSSNLDVAIVLAALHAHNEEDPFIPPTDARILATAQKLEEKFAAIYPINRRTADFGGMKMAPAIGRYPEDRYDGVGTEGEGGAWVLATAGMAQMYYLRGDRTRGDEFMRRVAFHAYPDGSLSEQMNRHNGYMQGATDLTWSHASVLTAGWARGNRQP